MRLAEGDAVAVELRGARHDEQRVAILLDLRPLMGVVGILDRKVMQLALPLHAAEHRHVRLAQADPDHGIGLAAPARGLIDGDVADTPASTTPPSGGNASVEGEGDDATFTASSIERCITTFFFQ